MKIIYSNPISLGHLPDLWEKPLVKVWIALGFLEEWSPLVKSVGNTVQCCRYWYLTVDFYHRVIEAWEVIDFI